MPVFPDSSGPGVGVLAVVIIGGSVVVRVGWVGYAALFPGSVNGQAVAPNVPIGCGLIATALVLAVAVFYIARWVGDSEY